MFHGSPCERFGARQTFVNINVSGRIGAGQDGRDEGPHTRRVAGKELGSEAKPWRF